jgi:hypothetical protein
MPCSDERGTNADYISSAFQEKIDKLTRLLCEANRVIDHLELKHRRSPGPSRSRELREWWEDHKRMDKEREEQAKRIKQEYRIRQEARNKLTPEERRVLGIR